MEADGSSGSSCSYCNRVGHRTEECRERSGDRRFEIAGGCLVGLILMPLVLLGAVLGSIGGALWAGFCTGLKYWPTWAQRMRQLFRREAP